MDTFHTVESYDLNKIPRDTIHYRTGYIHEHFEAQGTRFSLHNIPVLSDGKKAFGSQFCRFNTARVDVNTQEMLTVMFGFGLSIEYFNAFAHNLILLKNAQEKQSAVKTTRMQIISGYPAVYELNCLQTPTILTSSPSIFNPGIN